MGFLLWRLPFAAILVLYDFLESYENTVENCENAVEHTIALENWERSSDDVRFPIVLRQNSWSLGGAHSRVLGGDIGGVTVLDTIADRAPRCYSPE